MKLHGFFALTLLVLFSCNSSSTPAGPAEASQPKAGGPVSSAPASSPESTGQSAPSTSITETPAALFKKMVEIPAGSFVYGTSEQEFDTYFRLSTFGFPGMKEQLRKTFVIPKRDLRLPRFYIDPFEITNAQFRDFVSATGYRPADRKDLLKDWRSETEFPDWAATFPVVWISQQDAQAYCRWRGGHLPSEEEWEKAARGTKGVIFPWGNVYPRRETANFATRKPEPAGNRPGDRSPFGVYDLAGNVSEWTASLQMYRGQQHAVVRGGNFLGAARDMMTVHRTLIYLPKSRAETVGFRCVLEHQP